MDVSGPDRRDGKGREGPSEGGMVCIGGMGPWLGLR